MAVGLKRGRVPGRLRKGLRAATKQDPAGQWARPGANAGWRGDKVRLAFPGRAATLVAFGSTTLDLAQPSIQWTSPRSSGEFRHGLGKGGLSGRRASRDDLEESVAFIRDGFFPKHKQLRPYGVVDE